MFVFAVKRSTSLRVEQNFRSTLNEVLRFTANPNTIDFVNFLCFPDEYIQGVVFLCRLDSVILCITVAVYAPVLRAPFWGDDDLLIKNNPLLTEAFSAGM